MDTTTPKKRLLALAGLVVVLTTNGANAATPNRESRRHEVAPTQGTALHHPAGEESNLVVTRFLLAAALGDRHTACALFPTHRPCQRGERFVGPGDFRLLAITLIDPDHPAVSAHVGGATGSFALTRAGRSFVISQARGGLARVLRAAPPEGQPGDPAAHWARADPNLVVTRFLVAAALGDRGTACAMYPGYLFCQPGHWARGPADFNVIDITLADPTQPTVFANVGGIRGYFVLARVRRSLVIIRAGAD